MSLADEIDAATTRLEAIAREAAQAREYADLDIEEPATWERDLLRSIAAAQRALVLIRAERVCGTCRGTGRVSDPNLFGAFVSCPACRP